MTETNDRTPEVRVRTPEASSRLYRAAAWVGIVAGVVFITTAVFFAGLVAGRMSDRDDGWHRGPMSGQQMGPGGMAGCPMMQSGGMSPPMAPRP